ncbi:MAG: FKBP-type peptidyl-prolyl cis-trans isomerase [Bacteroidaceae bacterium]|nr:FKBP-type peptidyl-prolyl cis-trans isomerase [Bacteroidaceae bacterium]
MDRTSVDPANKQLAAYNAGGQIGGQILTMAQNFSKDYYEADPDKSVDPKIVAYGIIMGLTGQSEIKADSASQVFQTVMNARQADNKERLYGENRRAGEKFLEENKSKEGVITLPSGLQYKVITEGTGEKPKTTDKVKVNYEGKLIDGTVFDSSIKRGQPATFQVNQVIKGWTEALKLMPVGSKWEIYIPYQLAYGDRATGKDIKPYSALTFSVELLEIEAPAKKK